jgi:FtsZ-binding cell division protein ZapB
MSRNIDKIASIATDAISDLLSEVEELESKIDELEKANDKLSEEIDEINRIATDFENDAAFWRNKFKELNKNNNYTLY